jgi:hypothetical protein
MKGQLPNFLVIGAMKCGTTSLHYYLNQHPDIFMSVHKELNYYVTEFNFSKGVEWYREHFVTNKYVRGESSPSYSKYHIYAGVPERIYNLIPDVKFIYITRNPIKRFASHVQEAISLGNRRNDFNPNTELKDSLDTSNYTLSGMYALQLEKYLTFFTPDKFKVISLEALNGNPIETMNEVYEFLGVNRINESSLNAEKKNTYATKYTKTSFGRFVSDSSIISSVKSILPQKLKYKLKSNGIYESMATEKVKKINLDPDIINRLTDIYSRDLEKLENILGYPVKGLKI